MKMKSLGKPKGIRWYPGVRSDVRVGYESKDVSTGSLGEKDHNGVR